MPDRWYSPGLETRGRKPNPENRSDIAKFIHIELSRMLRTELSINLIHGNSWSGYLENGNPYGPPRPGPISVIQGIQH